MNKITDRILELAWIFLGNLNLDSEFKTDFEVPLLIESKNGKSTDCKANNTLKNVFMSR